MTEKFDVILADPPWRYNFSKSSTRKIENHYPTMTIEEICGIDCCAADNAILYLWATAPKIEEAFKVIKAWGFTYKTQMVWVKDKIGMGYYCRNQHEIIMIATKGKFHPPLPENRPSSVLMASRKKHSKKPLELYGMIEAMYPNMKYYEMFCRAKRNGWEVFGNEVPSYVQHTINDFDLCLDTGIKGENMFSSKFGKLFNTQLSHIHFANDSITQKEGIDFKVWIKEIKYEVKTRSYNTHRYGDILFETISVIETDKAGWLYTTKSDYIFYLWMNQKMNGFIDGYSIDVKLLRKWLKTIDITKYDKKIATSIKGKSVWTTENRPIPIKDIPKSIIKKLIIR